MDRVQWVGYVHGRLAGGVCCVQSSWWCLQPLWCVQCRSGALVSSGLVCSHDLPAPMPRITPHAVPPSRAYAYNQHMLQPCRRCTR
jgi:hypothetical protein